MKYKIIKYISSSHFLRGTVYKTKVLNFDVAQFILSLLIVLYKRSGGRLITLCNIQAHCLVACEGRE
jgi:hypothetical protein